MKSQAQWEQPGVVQRYANRRHQEFELVRSERHFLPAAFQGMRNMLDVGCASGGMFNMLTQMGMTIPYTGLDFSQPSIELAQKRYGHLASFIHADAHSLPLASVSFSLVHARGLLPHIGDWQVVMDELLRVMRKRVLVDIRFASAPSRSNYSIAVTADAVDFYTVSQNDFYDYLPRYLTVKRFDQAYHHAGTDQDLTESTMLIEL